MIPVKVVTLKGEAATAVVIEAKLERERTTTTTRGITKKPNIGANGLGVASLATTSINPSAGKQH